MSREIEGISQKFFHFLLGGSDGLLDGVESRALGPGDLRDGQPGGQLQQAPALRGRQLVQRCVEPLRFLRIGQALAGVVIHGNLAVVLVLIIIEGIGSVIAVALIVRVFGPAGFQDDAAGLFVGLDLEGFPCDGFVGDFHSCFLSACGGWAKETARPRCWSAPNLIQPKNGRTRLRVPTAPFPKRVGTGMVSFAHVRTQAHDIFISSGDQPLRVQKRKGRNKTGMVIPELLRP